MYMMYMYMLYMYMYMLSVRGQAKVTVAASEGHKTQKRRIPRKTRGRV